jgi:hypothetical protein
VESLDGFRGLFSMEPVITALSGSAVIGEKLNVQIQPPGKQGMPFRPTVLAVAPEREFRWRGKVLINGLFDGEHYFHLESHGQGTKFIHGERFTGLLAPLLSGALVATEQGFKQMNEQLKRRAEG